MKSSSTSSKSVPIGDRNCDAPTLIPIPSRTISGTIPKWVSGSLIRNGPGVTKVGTSTYNHLFDGLAVLHKFTMHNGQVTYQSRALESDTYKKNMAAQRIVVGEFGTAASTYSDPCDTIFQRWKSMFVPEMTDNASVNVAYIGGRDELYALGETNFIRQIDPKTLETIGEKTDLSTHTALLSATPHPHRLGDGTVVNVGMSWDKWKCRMQYSFIKVPSKGGFQEARVVGTSVPSRWRLSPAYFHSFGVTSSGSKAVLLEQPLSINLLQSVLNNLSHKPLGEALQWDPRQKTLLHVVNLGEEEEAPPVSVRYEANDLFVFHHINCYEEEGNLVVDVAGYNDAEMLMTMSGGKGNDECDEEIVLRGLTPRRYVLPLFSANNNDDFPLLGVDLLSSTKGGATAVVVEKNGPLLVVEVKPQLLHPEWLELPQINPKYNGRKYRYVYGLSGPITQTSAPVATQISKLDVTTGERLDFSAGTASGLLFSEPVFVPRPPSEAELVFVPPPEEQGGGAGCWDEDDGVVLTAALHENDPNYVALIILNARDMSQLASAEFQAIGHVSPTFHGLWTQLTK